MKKIDKVKSKKTKPKKCVHPDCWKCTLKDCTVNFITDESSDIHEQIKDGLESR